MRPPFTIPTPPGQIIFAGKAKQYARRMRRIFDTRSHGSNAVLITVDGSRHWVVVVPDLTVIFTQVGVGVITVDPMLAITDAPAPQSWPPANFAQSAINATADFLLRIAPTGRPQ